MKKFAALLSLICFPYFVMAQDLGTLAQQNMAFDQQFNAQLGGLMQQNQMQQQQMMQNYIQQNGPQLRQQYQQFVQSTGMQIPFEQFVYSHIITAGGTNPAPALQQQQQNFQALQNANKTVQQGYDSYNQGWANNQQAQSQIFDRNSQAMRGNAYYHNPQTGETHELPYGAPPGVYGNNQNTFTNDNYGQYRQVDPQGYQQDLQYADPYSDWED